MKTDAKRAYQKAWAEANADRLREKWAAWYQTNRPEILARQNARYAANPLPQRARSNAYRAANPKKNAAYQAAWRARAAGATGSHTQEEWEALLRQFDGKCAYCGADATTRDHVVPLIRGGADSIDNIAPACHSCNSSKRDRPVSVFLMSRAAATAVGTADPSTDVRREA